MQKQRIRYSSNCIQESSWRNDHLQRDGQRIDMLIWPWQWIFRNGAMHWVKFLALLLPTLLLCRSSVCIYYHFNGYYYAMPLNYRGKENKTVLLLISNPIRLTILLWTLFNIQVFLFNTPETLKLSISWIIRIQLLS